MLELIDNFKNSNNKYIRESVTKIGYNRQRDGEFQNRCGSYLNKNFLKWEKNLK